MREQSCLALGLDSTVHSNLIQSAAERESGAVQEATPVPRAHESFVGRLSTDLEDTDADGAVGQALLNRMSCTTKGETRHPV
jgi:hypothetical protein